MNVDNNCNLSEDQKDVLNKLANVSDLANTTLETNNELFDKLKEQLANPETRETVLFSVIKNSTEALMAIDKQFSEITLSVEALLKGHNDLVKMVNETIGNRSWLASIVDTRLNERETLAIEEHQICDLNNRLTIVRSGFIGDENKPKLEVGQIRTFIRYPMNPTQFSEEDLDRFSSNVVETIESHSSSEHTQISKQDNKVLFSAVSLFFSEYYTGKVQEGLISPTVIKTLDGKDYVLLDIYLDVEILSNSVSDTIEKPL